MKIRGLMGVLMRACRSAWPPGPEELELLREALEVSAIL
jgi:hypothetical protein